MREEHLWNDPYDMYIDFGVLGNVSSGIENILDMNFNYALLNDFFEVGIGRLNFNHGMCMCR